MQGRSRGGGSLYEMKCSIKPNVDSILFDSRLRCYSVTQRQMNLHFSTSVMEGS